MKKSIERFKKSTNAKGEVVWHFQAFKTTRRGFKTKREAQLAYFKMEQERKNVSKSRSTNITFCLLSQKWYEYYCGLNEQKEVTYLKRKEQLKVLNRWIGDLPINKLNSEKLQDFMFFLKEKGKDGKIEGYSRNTLYSLRQVINMVFKYGVTFKLMEDNPLSRTRIPKYKLTVEELKSIVNNVEEKYLTVDELKLLLDYSLVYEEFPLSILFHILFYTGCRIGEALALQPDDFDFCKNEVLFYKQVIMNSKTKNFTIESTKTFSSARRVVITDSVMSKIRDLIDMLSKLRKQYVFQSEEFYLFVYLQPSKRGLPFRREYVNDHIKSCVRNVGINKEFHTHLTRHTMASLCSPYCSLEVIKNRLGHSDSTVTKIYRHITSEEKLKPLEAFTSLES